VAAQSDASDEAAPGRPSAAPARAVVLTSLIQLVAVAMNLRLRHRRSLRAIERNLAASDPSLTKPQSTAEIVVLSGASTRKVPSELGRWELLSFHVPG
jgi:HAMP domain-containing protein